MPRAAACPARRLRPRHGILSLGSALSFLVAGQALALQPDPKEAEILKACERRLCTMALTKKVTGDDFKCPLTKTWAKDTLKKGENKAVKWGFGDAKCAVTLSLSQADIIAALTQSEHTIDIPSHTVKCTVDREGEAKPVTAKLAPRLMFKDGKADKIWINLADVDGPATITATVWTAANLEDSLGIFHKGMIKSVNKFLYQRCAKLYDANGNPKPEPGKPAVKTTTPAKPAQKPAVAKATTTAPANAPQPPSAEPPKAAASP